MQLPKEPEIEEYEKPEFVTLDAPIQSAVQAEDLLFASNFQNIMKRGKKKALFEKGNLLTSLKGKIQVKLQKCMPPIIRTILLIQDCEK